MNGEYPIHNSHCCIDDYIDPDGEWLLCPCYGLKPKVWLFDNGRSTACGCWKSMFDHFSIHAESIMSVHKRSGSVIAEYESDELRQNWNHWCETGKELFVSSEAWLDGRW